MYDYFSGKRIPVKTNPDSCMVLQRLNSHNEDRLLPCDCVGDIYNEQLDCPGLLFLDSYRHLYTEVYFYRGRFLIGSSYGTDMNREEIHYIKEF